MTMIYIISTEKIGALAAIEISITIRPEVDGLRKRYLYSKYWLLGKLTCYTNLDILHYSPLIAVSLKLDLDFFCTWDNKKSWW